MLTVLTATQVASIRAAAQDIRKPRKGSGNPDGFLTVQDEIDLARKFNVTLFDIDQALTTDHDHPQSCATPATRAANPGNPTMKHCCLLHETTSAHSFDCTRHQAPEATFASDLFSYNAPNRTYVSEASTLGLPPGTVPQQFTMTTAPKPVCPGVVCRCDDHDVQTCPMHGKKTPPLVFVLVRADKDREGEVTGWRYKCGAVNALIIND